MSGTAVTYSPNGLADWMRRVLEQCDRAAIGFDPEPVHELRVALRRCRTMADSLMRIDPDPDWRRVKRIGGRLFRALGELRDTQVMMAWAERIAPAGDPLRFRLIGTLAEREATLKMAAAAALGEFAKRRWERLSDRLPERIRMLPADGAVFESLALERFDQAFALHRAALRRRSGIGWHDLRIGLKRFRYVVENFLPQRHASWGKDLKHLQDLLGEVHDLDVLMTEVRYLRPPAEPTAVARWKEWIATERAERLTEYRLTTRGGASPWDTWRSGLPQGEEVLATTRQRLTVWASLIDPDFRATQRVTRLALDLHDGLTVLGFEEESGGHDPRRILETAALLHGTAGLRSAPGYRKASRRLIHRMLPPPGWTRQELELVGLVVRYHRGAEPAADTPDLGALAPGERALIVRLAGELRVAVALVAACDPPPTAVDAEMLGDVLQLKVTAGIDRRKAAGRVAAAAHCLGAAIGSPVLVRSRFPRA